MASAPFSGVSTTETFVALEQFHPDSCLTPLLMFCEGQ